MFKSISFTDLKIQFSNLSIQKTENFQHAKMARNARNSSQISTSKAL